MQSHRRTRRNLRNWVSCLFAASASFQMPLVSPWWMAWLLVSASCLCCLLFASPRLDAGPRWVFLLTLFPSLAHAPRLSDAVAEGSLFHSVQETFLRPKTQRLATFTGVMEEECRKCPRNIRRRTTAWPEGDKQKGSRSERHGKR